MENTLRALLFLLLVLSFSCEDQVFIVNCSECTEEEPVTGELYAKLDPRYAYESLIQIWEGNLEDSILFGSYYSYSSTFTQEVTLNKKYTITATYNTPDGKYIAVDSATPRAKYDKTQCDKPCYFIYDRKCNLRLNYTK